MEQIKINKLEIENVKRVKAVKIEPTMNGLTIIGGNNQQGKTSILDSIAWGLGGNKYKPSEPQREGSVLPPALKLTLSNGLIVERKGKNADLKVIDPSGQKAGQQLLDSFVEQFALDLPRFMAQTNKEKAQTVLQIIGVGDKLYELEKEEQEIYNRRHAIGQIADQKKKYAKEQMYYNDAPKEPVSASTLITQQQEILARNGENQRHRNNLQDLLAGRERTQNEYNDLQQKLIELQNKIDINGSMLKEYDANIEIAQKTVEQLQDESTEELERNIREIDEINRKVRANLDKDKAEDDAKEYEAQYDELSLEINRVRKAKAELLDNADLPLEGLSVDDGDLIYKGFKWDNMSGAEQLKVSTAIVRKLNPKCGFVLIDKLEQMDMQTLSEFGRWLEQEGLQAIATRVSTGDECSIIIEDGYAIKNTTLTHEEEMPVGAKSWQEGKF